MIRCNYNILKITPAAIYIVDLNRGMSITNDAEAVVEHFNIHYPGKRIIYRDTMNEWGELLHKNGVFTGFGSIANADGLWSSLI